MIFHDPSVEVAKESLYRINANTVSQLNAIKENWVSWPHYLQEALYNAASNTLLLYNEALGDASYIKGEDLVDNMDADSAVVKLVYKSIPENAANREKYLSIIKKSRKKMLDTLSIVEKEVAKGQGGYYRFTLPTLG